MFYSFKKIKQNRKMLFEQVRGDYVVFNIISYCSVLICILKACSIYSCCYFKCLVMPVRGCKYKRLSRRALALETHVPSKRATAVHP